MVIIQLSLFPILPLLKIKPNEIGQEIGKYLIDNRKLY